MEYVYLKQSKLYVKVKIVHGNGSNLSSPEYVGPTNILAGSMFSKVDVTFRENRLLQRLIITLTSACLKHCCLTVLMLKHLLCWPLNSLSKTLLVLWTKIMFKTLKTTDCILDRYIFKILKRWTKRDHCMQTFSKWIGISWIKWPLGWDFIAHRGISVSLPEKTLLILRSL